VEFVLFVIYLLIGFGIARSMKDDPSVRSSGSERLAWFFLWPFLYVRDFANWVVNTFEDD
jgi:hypothetical protein